jgi:hypothetical protein
MWKPDLRVDGIGSVSTEFGGSHLQFLGAEVVPESVSPQSAQALVRLKHRRVSLGEDRARLIQRFELLKLNWICSQVKRDTKPALLNQILRLTLPLVFANC